jgi:hypothetical protein
MAIQRLFDDALQILYISDIQGFGECYVHE